MKVNRFPEELPVFSLIVFLTVYFLVGCNSPEKEKFDRVKAHAHNDYAQAKPFWNAYDLGFGSIEADVFLDSAHQLLVAHEAEELANGAPTLDSLYLQPLDSCYKKNNGHPFADSSAGIQLLIDIKTGADSTLPAIIAAIRQHPQLATSSQIRFSISGNRPAPDQYSQYPDFIWFDGRPGETYTESALKKLGLISVSFRNYSAWDGKTELSAEERKKLEAPVKAAHALGKPFRYWATPDTEKAWQELQKMGVDYINTDRQAALAAFLQAN